MLKRPLLRSLVAAGFTAGVVALSAQPASAHVTISPTGTDAGDYTVLTFAFGHGCAGSPTESLEIQLPDEVLAATPTVTPGWSIDINRSDLDEPIEHGHGEITERIDSIVYTADAAVPDDHRAALDLQIQIPQVDPGTVLEFPTIQTCTEGEEAWIQATTDGTEPDYPAPAFTVTGDPAPAAADEPSSWAPVAWVGVGIGIAALAVGGLALSRTRN